MPLRLGSQRATASRAAYAAASPLIADEPGARVATTLGASLSLAALCAVAVIAEMASSFVPYPYREPLFAFAALGVAALMLVGLTRQRRMLAALRRREALLAHRSSLFHSTFEAMGDGLSVFDRQGRLSVWNTRFADLLGLPTSPAAGISLYEILLTLARRGDFGVVNPEICARERSESFYRELPKTGEWTNPAGRTLLIRRDAMPDGSVVSLYSDITERKAVEREMAEARSQAELANRAKGEFLANMSHELRTPLNAIIGFSEALSNGLLGPAIDPKQLEYIKDIHASGLLLLSIINDVLDMSKIDAGKIELAQEQVKIGLVIAEALRIVGERAQSRSVELVCTLPPRDIDIFADERAIKQILLNLLSNAVKFSEAGGQVDVRASADGAGRLVLEVEDRGIGMTAAEIDRALQPFGQAGPTTTKTHGGTGLGLPIAKGLVEAHGGTLEVESSPRRGTLVRVAVPLRPAVAGAERAAA